MTVGLQVYSLLSSTVHQRQRVHTLGIVGREVKWANKGKMDQTQDRVSLRRISIYRETLNLIGTICLSQKTTSTSGCLTLKNTQKHMCRICYHLTTGFALNAVLTKNTNQDFNIFFHLHFSSFFTTFQDFRTYTKKHITAASLYKF